MTSRGIWINGVNVALSPSFPQNGRCPTCHEPFTDVEMSSDAPRQVSDEPHAERVSPAKIDGPYFTPCGHDAASVFAARLVRRGEQQ